MACSHYLLLGHSNCPKGPTITLCSQPHCYISLLRICSCSGSSVTTHVLLRKSYFPRGRLQASVMKMMLADRARVPNQTSKAWATREVHNSEGSSDSTRTSTLPLINPRKISFCTTSLWLKIKEKVTFNIASEASYVYILRGRMKSWKSGKLGIQRFHTFSNLP